MKNTFRNITFVIFFLLTFLSFTQAQNYNAGALFKVKDVQSPYVEVGGMFFPGPASIYNFNVGFGYQFNTFMGLGVSFHNSSSWEVFKDKYNGFGFDYRIQNETWWFKNTVGFVNNYFPSQRSLHYEYTNANEKNDFFFRSSIGWIPRGGVFKVGLIYHTTNPASFNAYSCPPPTPECNFLFTQDRKVSNLQLYIGIFLPNPNRKNLDRILLKK